MFAISLAYPLGRVHAAEAGEPPAWSRLYSALIAAAYRGSLMPGARDALVWLEHLGPPCIADSPSRADAALPRYVPANDDARLPRERHRTARTFDTAVLADHNLDFQYLWPQASPPEALIRTLYAICMAVTHVGTTHAIALVGIVETPRPADWIPTDRSAELTMRTILPGRLAESDRVFESGQRLHAGACETWTAYRRAAITQHSAPGRLLALRLDGVLAAEHAIHLSAAVMAALQAEIPDEILDHEASGVHGHVPDEASRLRVIPLPDVGHRHASGRILGVLLDMPMPGMRPAVLSSLSRLGPLMLPGAKRVALLAPLPGRPLPVGLRPATWTTPSRTWTTALAAVLDRFPKKSLPVERIVGLTCRNAGLPEPETFQIAADGFLRGVGNAQAYAMRQKQLGPRAHLRLHFGQPLCPEVPISIGRGRNYGLGLLRPLPDIEET